MSSSASASNSKVPDAHKEQAKETQLNLGVLEEDDEFEEFPVAGENFQPTNCSLVICSTLQIGRILKQTSHISVVLLQVLLSPEEISYGKITGMTMTLKTSSVCN